MFKSNFYYFIFTLFAALFFIIGSPALAADYDFEVTSMSVSPSKPYVFHECTITIQVKHNGEADLVNDNGISAYDFFAENFDIREVTWTDISSLSPIESGESITYTIKGTFTKIGEWDLSFLVNEGQTVPEPYMNDNDYRGKIEAVPAEDLQAYELTLEPAYPAENQTCTVIAKVKNNGEDDLVNNFGLQSYSVNISDFTEIDRDIPDVDSQNRIEIDDYAYYRFEGKFTSSGDKEVAFEIDKNNEVEENNEENNTIEKTFKIGGATGTDLLVNDISFSEEKTELVKDEEYTITISVENAGDISITEERGILTSDINYSFPGLTVDDIEYLDDFPTLEESFDPGDKFRYKFTVTPKSVGEFDLSFTANFSKRLTESNLENNSSSTKIVVYGTQEKADDFTISGLDYTARSSSSIEFSWQTSKAASCHIEMKTGHHSYPSYLSALPITSWPATSDKSEHEVTINDLYPGATHTYRVVCENGLVDKDSDEASLTTPASDEVSILGGVSLTVSQSNKTITMDWDTDLGATSYIYYKKLDAANYTGNGSGNFQTGHLVTTSELTAGDYEAYAYSKTQENTEVSSQIFYFAIIGDEGTEEGDTEEEDTEESESNQPADSQSNTHQVGNQNMYKSLKGKILLTVEQNGEAYYVNPSKEEMYYLGRPADAFSVMREQGVGITDSDLAKVPLGLVDLTGEDTDGDGLSDLLEDAIGSDPAKTDTDGDGFPDKDEVQNGYQADGSGQAVIDNVFAGNQKGKIFLQVEKNGEAWYISPADGKRYFLGRPADAFSVMRNLGLGISNHDFDNLQ